MAHVACYNVSTALSNKSKEVHFKIFFLSILITATLLAKVEKWSLESIPVYRWTEVKHRENPMGWENPQVVYKRENLYLKIWEPHEARSENFMRAYRSGAFEDIAPLKAIVIDKNHLCRGYVTWHCEPIHQSFFGKRKVKISEWMKKADPEQVDAVMQLLVKMRDKTVQLGFFYLDLQVFNIGIDEQGKCYLFDLDGILEFDVFRKLRKKFAWQTATGLLSAQEIERLSKEYKKR
jgi:hypothetical protein